MVTGRGRGVRFGRPGDQIHDRCCWLDNNIIKQNRCSRVKTETCTTRDRGASSFVFHRIGRYYYLLSSLVRVYTCAAVPTRSVVQQVDCNTPCDAFLFFFPFLFSYDAGSNSFFDPTVRGFWIWGFFQIRSSLYTITVEHRLESGSARRPLAAARLFLNEFCVWSNDTIMTAARFEKRLLFTTAVLLGTLLGE